MHITGVLTVEGSSMTTLLWLAHLTQINTALAHGTTAMTGRMYEVLITGEHACHDE
jgi:hypothetical protein